MKIGMIPFNGWMPLTYSAAPIPAAAVLSGAGVKAGVIGLIRFLPLGVRLEGWGMLWWRWAFSPPFTASPSA